LGVYRDGIAVMMVPRAICHLRDFRDGMSESPPERDGAGVLRGGDAA